MNENNYHYWSKEWLNMLISNLSAYIERDGSVSEMCLEDIVSNMLEVNQSIDLLRKLSKQNIRVDYLSDINNVFLLTKECAKKNNSLSIVFSNVSENLAGFLRTEGYNIGNVVTETKLTNKNKLRELEIAKFESTIRNACSKSTAKLSKCQTMDELLDQTALLLVKSYYKKKLVGN